MTPCEEPELLHVDDSDLLGANRPIVIDNPDSETPAISVPKYNLIAQKFSYGKDDYKSIIGINYNGCDYYKSGFTESLWKCSGK